MEEYYYPRNILIINDNEIISPTMKYLIAKLFELANKEGLKGQKVYNLIFQEPSSINSLDIGIKVYCKYKCTKEERARFDEFQKINVEHAVINALSED